MDNPGSTLRAPEARFRPDRRFTAAAGAGAVLALIALALAGDGPSRLFAGLNAVVLLGYAVGDLVFAPRLVVSAAGLTIRAPLTRAKLTWPAVERVEADVRRRYGLRSTTLEIDAGEVLAVFSRRALGAEPEEVAGIVAAFRPPPHLPGAFPGS